MDYYDGNTVTGAVELRAELRDERQQLRHQLRPVHAGRAEPDLGQRRRRRRRSARPPGQVVAGPGRRRLGGQQAASAPSTATSTRPSMTAPTPATPRRNPVGVMTGQNIGDLLNARNVTWGWFQGGFAPTGTNAAGFAGLRLPRTRTSAAPRCTDYSPHHNPFEYYKSTANPKHLPPTSEAEIGHTDQANHQYDLTGLLHRRCSHGNMPAVSFLKAGRLPGRPRRRTPTRWTSSTSSSTRSTRSSSRSSGARPRS